MKGVVVKAIEKLVVKISDIETWEKVLEKSSFEKDYIFLIRNDIPDERVLGVISAVAEVLNLSLNQVFDAFGDFWINDFTSDIYAPFYEEIHDAKTFLKELDNIHLEVTKMIPNAHPPRFTYEEPDDKTLIITYISVRGLIDLFISIAKGLVKKYNEDVEITKIGITNVKLVWK